MDYAPPPPLPLPPTPDAACLAGLWSHLPAPSAALRATVIIPARDESAELPATLAALAAQVSPAGQPWPVGSFEVLVLANNCHDDTARVVRTFARANSALALHVAEITLPPTEAHVGRARRLLLDEAARRLELAANPAACLISTDADTRVAPDWLAATFRELAAGADAVCGRILMADSNPACPVRRRQLQDATYHLLRARLETLLAPAAHDPWPRHHQHFGASFALTPAAYRRVGGLPVVPYLEDEALYQALLRHDLRVRHSPAVRVYTSGRRQGRVAVGLSWQLREWASLGAEEALVPNPEEFMAELRARQELRQHWPAGLAPDRPVPAPLVPLVAAMPGFASFGAFWEWARPQLLPARGFAAVPLHQAITALRRELARLAPAPAAR